MLALRIHDHGGPEALSFEDAPKPAPREGEALVRVAAAGVSPAELTWSSTYETRAHEDRLPSILGHEFAGVVEALGPGATGVTVGEAVYALSDFWRDGADAEYTVVNAEDLAPKPRTADFVAAAATPLSALTAWQALFDHADLAPGQTVLIHGAAGGVGSFAVQLAHWRGARVVATAAPKDAALVRGLGADEVIDYTTERFEDVAHDVDVVLDTVGGETLERSWRIVRRGGVIVTTVGESSDELVPKFGVRGVFFIVEPARQELIEIGDLIDQGAVRPVVTDVYPLAHAQEAFERGAAGHNRGKAVLLVEQAD
jgi:NADPH:quinone reductase-like Zn-dependent oxidoreductase